MFAQIGHQIFQIYFGSRILQCDMHIKRQNVYLGDQNHTGRGCYIWRHRTFVAHAKSHHVGGVRHGGIEEVAAGAEGLEAGDGLRVPRASDGKPLCGRPLKEKQEEARYNFWDTQKIGNAFYVCATNNEIKYKNFVYCTKEDEDEEE